MINRYVEGSAAAEMLERRWFAAFKAASAARADCEALIEEIDAMKTAWNHARARLEQLESLRDALGDELAELDGQKDPTLIEAPAQAGVLSAA
jgi:ribosomal 50S subunit-associated protein YjgA (DUF615 family)